MTRILKSSLSLSLAFALLVGCSDREEFSLKNLEASSQEQAMDDFLLSAEKTRRNHVELSLCEQRDIWTVKEVKDVSKLATDKNKTCVAISCDRVESMPRPYDKTKETVFPITRSGWLCRVGSDAAPTPLPTEPKPDGFVDACTVVLPAIACAISAADPISTSHRCSTKAKSGREYSETSFCDFDAKEKLVAKACQAKDAIDLGAIQCGLVQQR
jgi:hypothetical protein